MRKGLLAGSPPFTQTIMLVFTMVACSLFFMFIGMLLVPPILGIPIAEVMDLMKNGGAMQNLNLMRYMQTLYGFSLFIIPAFFAAYLFSGNAVGYLELGHAAPVKWFGWVLLLVILSVPCVNLLASLNEMISFPKSLSGLEQKLKAYEEAARQTTKLFMEVDNAGGMLFNIFMMAVLPALGEELIFRGALQKILIRWAGNVHVGVIIAGFMFSLMHMQFYGFFPRWLLGIMFGYLLVWSGTLWLPIFAHFVNNCMAVLFSYLVHKGIVPEEIEVFGSTWGDIPVTIVATTVCAWLLWKMYRNRVKANPRIIT